MRSHTIKDLSTQTYDVVIVGGGINGAVSAAALSAAGLRVALLEKKDFASSTSQESSNLVWGGIKYLESYEFGLVWDLCRSRNELMEKYPSSVREIRFFTTLQKGFRKPKFLVFLGSVLYWFMGRFFTKAPRLLTKRMINAEEPLVETKGSVGGLEYSDGYLRDNDARFVFQFIRRAMRSGASVLNYAELLSAKREAERPWRLEVKDHAEQKNFAIETKVLINASGPYADNVNLLSGIKTKHRHIFSKGVHLIVPRLTENKKVLTFFADDGRLFFVIPMGACSCIGTTDTPVTQLPPVVTSEDRAFILSNINKRLRLSKPLTMDDVISERCGVRPLVKEVNEAVKAEGEDWINLSRKHVIETKIDQRHITIFGGKLTDCLNIGRELYEELRLLKVNHQPSDDWIGESLRKGEFESLARAEGLDQLPPLPVLGEGTLIDRLWRCYDQDAFDIVARMQKDPSLKTMVSPKASVTLAEFAHMAEKEEVRTLEDALRRRTRLALVVSHEDLEASQELRRGAQLLFGERAEKEWENYFGTKAVPLPERQGAT